MNNSHLHQKILDGKRIPSLPKQAHRLLQAFNNEDLDYHKLTKIISDHPNITARLISLANSAWAAPAVPVNSLDRACINLGLKVVRSVSIGLALTAPFKTSACPAFDISRFWISGKLVADCAVLLASNLPNPPEDEYLQILHTGGLLHNLGLICLADLMPDETQQALSNANATPELTVCAALYQLIETDFCEVGGLFAEMWSLPDHLVAIIKFHRVTYQQNSYWESARLVGLSTIMVSALLSNQPQPPALSEEETLGISQADQQQIFASLQTLYIETIELAKALF